MNATDKELLEMAARAAGIPGKFREGHDPAIYGSDECNWGIWDYPSMWNPLECNDDAMRLAFQLRINILHHDGRCEVYQSPAGKSAKVRGEGLSDLRNAIVRAAAQIGKSMTKESDHEH